MSERQLQIQMSAGDALYFNQNTGEYLYNINELYASQQNYFYIKLINAIFPVSWYNVSSNLGSNLKFLFNSTNQVSVIIPDGNYDGETLASIIKTQVNLTGFNVSFNYITNKLTFSYTLPMSILGTTSYFLSKILGFVPNTNYLGTYDIPTNKYVLSSIYPINLAQITTICISLPNFSTNGLVLTQSYNRDNLLASVPVNVAPMNNIIFENQTGLVVNSESNDLRQFRIKITDQYGYPIQWNGIDWTISLLFEIVRFVD